MDKIDFPLSISRICTPLGGAGNPVILMGIPEKGDEFIVVNIKEMTLC
jgi:hypothetical protein